jgi:hypothetical protein
MIVTFTSSMPAKGGGLVWFPLEIPDCDDLDQLYGELRDRGCIRGDRIDTAVISGARRVIRRTPCILGVGALALITPLHVEVILEDGSTI